MLWSFGVEYRADMECGGYRGLSVPAMDPEV